jgi:hypothetical protein
MKRRALPRGWRRWLGPLIAAMGLAIVLWGLWMISTPATLVVLGAALIAFGLIWDFER